MAFFSMGSAPWVGTGSGDFPKQGVSLFSDVRFWRWDEVFWEGVLPGIDATLVL